MVGAAGIAAADNGVVAEAAPDTSVALRRYAFAALGHARQGCGLTRWRQAAPALVTGQTHHHSLHDQANATA